MFLCDDRTCIGNYFAQIESGIIMCHLLRQYELVAEPSYRPKIQGGISLTTSNGIHVQVHRRR